MLLNTKIAKKSSGATLLWTNSSPNSAFSPTVVTLESGYSYYLVEFKERLATSGNITIVAFSYTETAFYSGATITSSEKTGYQIARKINYVRDGVISFGSAYYGEDQATNNYKIPLRIWGIK